MMHHHRGRGRTKAAGQSDADTLGCPSPRWSFQISTSCRTVADTKGKKIAQRQAAPRGGGSSGVWLPPTPEEITRATRVGERGEPLMSTLVLLFGVDIKLAGMFR